MASMSMSGRGFCKYNVAGRVCKSHCQEWDPSKVVSICECCEHHISFHESFHPTKLGFGRCLKEHGDDGSLYVDGCQEFFPSLTNQKYCAGCKCHRNSHKKVAKGVEIVVDVANPSSVDCGQTSMEPKYCGGSTCHKRVEVIADLVSPSSVDYGPSSKEPSRKKLKLDVSTIEDNSNMEVGGDLTSPSSVDYGATLMEPSLNFDVPFVGNANIIANSDQALEPKHKIFLSHSGSQKDFVEQLCIDLERCDRYPFFDKRQHSLPIGEKFPKLIFDGIQQCQVGVVIVSKDFFTKTKWPMLELVAMVKEQRKANSTIKIIPVFFDISHEDCCDEENHKEWLKQWQVWAKTDEKRIDINDWVDSLKVFGPINGLVMKEGKGEVKLRAEIVEAVCKHVLPETRWDDSHMQGRLRVCKVIQDKINLETNSPRSGVRVVGLYGMGGIGKSAICKALCNALFSEFHGRVCHAELKSASELELFREVLKNLTDISHEVLGTLNVVDKCLDQLKKRIVKEKIFLAIDNVSDESIKQAKTYLGAGFQNGSVIIVTARSLVDLKRLNIHEDDCLEMPTLEEDEARSLFLNHATSNPDVRMDEELVARCLKRCRFVMNNNQPHPQTPHYHPLALEVLGEQLCCLDPMNWEDRLRTFDMKDPIFSILRSSFESLTQEDQLLFIDVALFVPEHYYLNEMWNLFQWLGMVHGSNTDKIRERLEGLKKKSLLENLGDGFTKIGVHDLWREFCIAKSKAEKFKDRQIFYALGEEHCHGLDESSPSRHCWENLKRMCFSNQSWLNGVSTKKFANVTVLKLISEFVPPNQPLDLDLSGLKHLKSLDMKTQREWTVNLSGLRMLQHLVFLRWKEMPESIQSIHEMGYLLKLQEVELEGFKGETLPDIGNLTSLRAACFWKSEKVKTITGLGELTALEELHLSHCLKLESLPFLEKLNRLRILDIGFCPSMRELPGLGDAVSLEEIQLPNCPLMTTLPNLQKLGRLWKLNISYCIKLTALSGLSNLVSLEEFDAWGCLKLATLCDTSKLTKLRSLDLGGCPMQSVPSFDGLIGLQQLWASFKFLCVWPDLHKLSSLRSIVVEGWSGPGLASVANLGMLENLVVLESHKVDKLPDLQNLTQLQRLRLRTRGLKDLSGLSNLSKLQSLFISDCFKLDSFPDMQRLTSLKSLTILKCKRPKQVWTIVRQLSSLKTLEVEVASNYSMKILPDLHMLKGLRSLSLIRGGYVNMLGIGSLFQLETLKCKDLPVMKVPDLQAFPQLQTLWFEKCMALKSLTCTKPLVALEVVRLNGCPGLLKFLKNLPDSSSFLTNCSLQDNDIVEVIDVDDDEDWTYDLT